MRTLLCIFSLALLFACKDPVPGPVDPKDTPGYKMYGHIKPADFVGNWEYRIDRDDKEAYMKIVISEEGSKLKCKALWFAGGRWIADDNYPEQELIHFTDYENAHPVAKYPSFEILEYLKFKESLIYRIHSGSPHLQLGGRLYLYKGK